MSDLPCEVAARGQARLA